MQCKDCVNLVKTEGIFDWIYSCKVKKELKSFEVENMSNCGYKETSKQEDEIVSFLDNLFKDFDIDTGKWVI